MRSILFLIISTFSLFTQINAQIEGDQLFKNDQIVRIDLNFNQQNFWDSLVINYETTTYMKADLTLTDASGTYVFNEVGVRLKGNSSYGHPGNKKSFKIDFNKYVNGQNYDGLKKLNFSNGFKDPSLIREKIFFDLCQDAEVAAPRANFANVYFNDILWGFYTVIEQIDDQFLDWKILDDDGNLFKAGSNFGGGPGGGGDAEADLKYYGPDQADYEDRYELKSNESENDWTDLIAFTDFINNSSNEDFENNINDHLELQEYLRSAALDNLFSNLDSYTNSARNYYIYHNLTSDKWEWIKWDGNESFGSYGGGPGLGDMTTLALNYHSNNRPLLENIFESELLYAQYESEMCFLLTNFFNPNYMHPHIDDIKSIVQASVYADENKMYSDDDFDTIIDSNISGGGGPGGNTTYGLKPFISQKHDYATGQLDCVSIHNEDDLLLGTISIYPNPINDFMTISLNKVDYQSFIIFNNLGQEIQNGSINNTDNQIDMSFFSSGLYYLKMVGNSTDILSSEMIPFVVEK